MPLPQLLEFGAALLAAGACGGLLAGLFGVGGGIITVPVLFTVFTLMHAPIDIAIHTAVGTSLATIIPGSMSSARAHARRGAVDFLIVKQWGPFIIVGAVLGGLIANHLSGTVLGLTFGVFAIFIAALMGFSPQRLRVASAPPTGIVQAVTAGLIGLISAVVGIGGGSLSVPTMVLCNIPVHRAIGTASLIGLFISLPAVVVFILTPTPANALPGTLGTVNSIAFALLAPMTMLMAPQGAKLAHKLPATKLRRAFAVFLFLVAVKMIMGVFR